MQEKRRTKRTKGIRMEIRLLEKNKSKVTFMIGKTSPIYANTLRRLLVNKVPTLAIEEVEIKKNSGALFDEVLAHRLGLLPLKTDLKSYTQKAYCKCKGEGCARCELKLKLKAKGPGNVYAESLKSDDPKVVPVYPKTPLVKLKKGQEVEFIATAVLGTGKEHSKWSPGLAHYRFKPVVEIPKKAEGCEEAAKVCPVKVFDWNNKLKINKDNLMKCTLCDACTEVCPNIKVSADKSSIIFTIESWGQLTPKNMVKSAIEEFNKTLDEFAKVISKS
jgi:DNA-directed RNA polymerase subunit D